MIAFTIYRYSTEDLCAVWTGSVRDDTAPIAFRPALFEFGPQMAVGDTLYLNKWHYAERVS